MIIKDKPIPLIQWAMIGVEKFLLSRFSKITFLDCPVIDRGVATLVLMNHFSFNDGPMMHFFCRTVLKKQFKVMVLEDQMNAFKVLKYIGCFSVNKKSKSLIESLDYASGLLGEPTNMVGIFPQGGVYSSHLNRIHFEKGLQRILKKNPHPVQVIFATQLTDYLSGFKPRANIYLGQYDDVLEAQAIEQAYNKFYAESKTKQQGLHQPPLHVIG